MKTTKTVLQSTTSRHMCREVPQKIELPRRVEQMLLNKIPSRLEKLLIVEACNQIFLGLTSSTSRRERLLVTVRTLTTARTSKKLPVGRAHITLARGCGGLIIYSKNGTDKERSKGTMMISASRSTIQDPETSKNVT